MSVTVTPMKTCKCGSFIVSSSEEAEPHFGYSKLGVISKHGVEVCVYGAQAAEEMEQELAALRTATRLRRPTPEQTKLTAPRYAGPVQGLARVPYEAFRAMLIDLSPTLTYFVEGVAFESGTYGASLRVKLRGVEVVRFLCDACSANSRTPAGESWTFEAIEPLCTETNQDVACPRCHSPNDTRRA